MTRLSEVARRTFISAKMRAIKMFILTGAPLHTVWITCSRIMLSQFRPYLSAPVLIILSRADHFTSRLVIQCNATQRSHVVFARVIIALIIWSSEPWARGTRARARAAKLVFHRDLGIKYLHDSSFASVYTAKLANPKYSAFTSETEN